MFKLENPSSDIQWRNLILFGKNSATYKFSSATTLLKLVDQGKTVVRRGDLSKPYSEYMIDRVKIDLGQDNNGRVIKTFKQFNLKTIGESEILPLTKSQGFKNVVNAL